MSEDFFLDPSQWKSSLPRAAPKAWAHVEQGPDPSADSGAPVAVSNITTGDDRISFDVDKVGVPVLVKASYFPNWQVSGTQGPYRVAPNLMVVIPTSTHVSLHYGRTPVDLITMFLTLLGIAGVVWLAPQPAARLPGSPAAGGAARPHERSAGRVGHLGGVEWLRWVGARHANRGGVELRAAIGSRAHGGFIRARLVLGRRRDGAVACVGHARSS